MLKKGIALVLAIAVAGAAFWAVRSPERPPCIVLVTVDTLRADRLGCYGNTPNGRSPSPVADALAEGGILFEKFTTPRGQTHPSLASFFFGKYPITHGLRDNFDKPHEGQTNFVELLREAGYATAGFASNMRAITVRDPHPTWWTAGFDEAGDGYGGDPRGETLRPLQDQWGWDDRVEKQALAWIGRHAGTGAESGKPFFLWVHFFDVHKPYLPHESCRNLLPPYDGPLALPDPTVKRSDPASYDTITPALDAGTLEGEPLAAADREYVLACYDAGIAGVDARVGRILDALEAKGLMENTWVLYSSDHGDELGDHNHYYYHGASIYESVLHIPLVVRPPEKLALPAGRRSSMLLQVPDVAPTLLELAGVALPEEMEGRSFLPALEGDESLSVRDHAFAEWEDLIYSVSDGRKKYIWNRHGACPVKPPWIAGAVGEAGAGFLYDFEELYDLGADPREQRNIVAGDANARTALRKVLAAWLREKTRPEGFRTGGAVGREDKEILEALGYTASDPSRRDVRFREK